MGWKVKVRSGESVLRGGHSGERILFLCAPLVCLVHLIPPPLLRCQSLEEIALVWKRECEELRKFADLEREAFQSVIDEISQELTSKEEIVNTLNERVGSLESAQVGGLHSLLSNGGSCLVILGEAV